MGGVCGMPAHRNAASPVLGANMSAISKTFNGYSY
jgi:hypothetical protein